MATITLVIVAILNLWGAHPAFPWMGICRPLPNEGSSSVLNSITRYIEQIIPKALDVSYSYAEYRRMLQDLFAEGKTTGEEQSEKRLSAAEINLSRMDRLDRKARFTPELLDALAELEHPLLLLAIAEGWCGDAAQILPLFNHLASATDEIDLRVVLRDENPELIDQFLTNGVRGIPIILFLDPSTLEVLTVYGPRPVPAQQIAQDYKNQVGENLVYDDFIKALHTWYARDKQKTINAELTAVLKSLQGVKQ